jgi:hypothetical protein
VNFRNRLIEKQQSGVAFQTALDALQEVGLISRQCRQRLDSTQMFGRVAKMSRLDCVRETIGLALKELEEAILVPARPIFWIELWEHYIESKVDYRSSAEILGRKLGQAGIDAGQLLEWLRQQWDGETGPQVQLLKRVFSEQFEVVAGQPAPLAKEKEAVVALDNGVDTQTPASIATPVVAEPASNALSDQQAVNTGAVPTGQGEFAAEAMAGAAQIQPRNPKQMDSDQVQNPHDPEATYGAKGKNQQKKEHVGYKVQVAESVSEAVLAPGEPTRNFITGIVTQQAHESDELGAEKMDQEQAQMGMEKPPVQYVDGAYISAQKLAQAQSEGRELIGPAQRVPSKDGRFTTEDFQVNVEERKAICPAGKASTQCSRIEAEATGKADYRFEFGIHCHDCPLRAQCLGKDQRHRTLVVGEHHTVLQARRLEQQTDAFKQRMKHRNGIEGTQSELVRGHGMRQARSRGLAKVRLQNYFIGAACNIKRWINRTVWQMRQTVTPVVGSEAMAALS